MAGVQGQCPQCGAPLTFGGAHSLAAVCSYCRSTIARNGADLQSLGKIPDLVATDSRLALSQGGQLDGKAFTIIGHVQLAHPSGGTWDEWYLSFADGTWGWLAEAQGRLYFTRPLRGAPNAPRRAAVRSGKTFQLPGAGQVTVDEVNEASFASAEGELPFTPRVGAVYHFADASGDDATFVTLDYGEGEDVPEVFAGRELSYAGAGLGEYAPSPEAGKQRGTAITCPNCGGPLSLRLAESESATCPSCNSLLDVSQGSARVLQALQGRARPGVPLGSKGTLHGEPLEVIGWVLRSVMVDQVKYTWSEYLLHGKGGYRWLSESAGHFVLLEPIPAGRVKSMVRGQGAICDGRPFRHFQSATASYEEIQGEFYWKLDVSQRVQATDYVAPPYMLSCERDANEVNWTLGRYVPAAEVWKAFGLSGRPPMQPGVGACQPNPYAGPAGRAWATAGIALAAVVILAFVLSAKSSGQAIKVVEVPLPAGPAAPPSPAEPASSGTPAPAEAPPAVVLSDPFELPADGALIELTARAPAEEAWVGLDVALINDETGETSEVGFELSHYSGVDDGERWSEGSNQRSETLGRLPGGRYVLRAEPQVERGAGTVGPAAEVVVARGGFLLAPLFLAIGLLVLWPLALSSLSSSFERRRWSESDHAPARGDDD